MYLSSNRTHGPCTTLQIGACGPQGRPGGRQGTVETAEGCPDGVYLDSHHTLLQLPAPATVPDLCLLWLMDLFTLGLCSLNLIPSTHGLFHLLLKYRAFAHTC